MMQASGYIASAGGFGRAPAVPQGRLLGVLHLVLTLGFLSFTLIGTHPFEEATMAARSDGNILDRIAVMSMFAVALVLLALRWRVALRLIARNAMFLLVILFCMATIVWSDYPGLTLRRGLLLIFLTTATLAIAAGTDDAVRLYRMLFVVLAAVIVINLVGTVLMPSRTITPIGVKGLYTQKNVAGIVGLITVLIGVAFVVGCNRPRERLWAILAIVAAGVFLVLTRSKTSVNLAVLGAGALVFFGLCERWGRPFILLSAILGIVGFTAAFIWLVFLDFDTERVLATFIGDTSFSGRDELWAFARRDAERRYWLGHGYGAFWDVGQATDPLVRAEPGSWLASVELGVINQAHHGYLELWLHVGRPATVAATIIVIAYAIYGAVKAIGGSGSPALRASFGGLAVLIAIHLVHNLTEATLFMRGQVFWSLVTLAMVILSRASDYERFERQQRGLP